MASAYSKKSSEKLKLEVKLVGCRTSIFIYKEDITKLQVDAIVNAANSQLHHLGGVAAAISRSAGPQMQNECDILIKEHGPIDVGECAVTKGFNLPAKIIIHTVGPNGHIVKDRAQFEMLLKSAIYNAVDAAVNLKVESLAMPLISSGTIYLKYTIPKI